MIKKKSMISRVRQAYEEGLTIKETYRKFRGKIPMDTIIVYMSALHCGTIKK